MKHRWDYEHPICLWEEMPWWLRWSVAFLLSSYLLGTLIAGTLLILRNS